MNWGIRRVKPGARNLARTSGTEILFIERIWDFLKPGTGRASGHHTRRNFNQFLIARGTRLSVGTLPD